LGMSERGLTFIFTCVDEIDFN